jgi:AraC family transcriptional regulator
MASNVEHSFHGLEIGVRRTSGARALRVVHPAAQIIDSHRHDWPLLTLPLLGGYDELCDDGSVSVRGPAAVIHPAGRCHSNCIHAHGMETFSIEFDPAWLRDSSLRAKLNRSYYCVGGAVSLAGRSLARLWAEPTAREPSLQKATAHFVHLATGAPQRAAPVWLGRAREHLESGERMTAADLASELGLNPRWLAHAYRSLTGEGLHETRRRRRVEHAVQLLRSTDEPIAEIAVTVGFCDQSHLNRALRQLTGRTPVQIRAEREQLSRLVDTPV